MTKLFHMLWPFALVTLIVFGFGLLDPAVEAALQLVGL
jgi:hypothetical protein